MRRKTYPLNNRRNSDIVMNNDVLLEWEKTKLKNEIIELKKEIDILKNDINEKINYIEFLYIEWYKLNYKDNI